MFNSLRKNFFQLTFIIFAFGLAIVPQAHAVETFNTIDIDGWQVNVDQALISSNPALAQGVENQLLSNLTQIVNLLPAKHVKELRRVPIYIQQNNPSASLFYSTGADLYVPATMAGAVVIGDPAQFYSQEQQFPSRILKILAYAYHFQVLGLDNANVLNAYNHAVASGLYKNVPNYLGQNIASSPALNTVQDYFAYLTQAYFERSYYYPFTNSDLKNYDPQGYNALNTVWKLREGPQATYIVHSLTPDDNFPGPSIQGTNPVVLCIRNNSAVPLVLTRINYKGQPVPYATIQPGNFYVQYSYATNVWSVSNGSTGDRIALFQLGGLGAFVSVGPDN